MEVIEIKNIEDCFDGTSIKELLLSEDISRELIFALGKDGDIQYFPNFARPFFKIRVNGRFDIKGIEGDRTIRIHLKDTENCAFQHFINSLRNG
jgi:hypothetical protein